MATCSAVGSILSQGDGMRNARKPKPGDDPNYLNFIRTRPCVCCYAELIRSEIGPEGVLSVCAPRPTSEAAHVGPRGLGQKCPDRQTVPLCAQHHRVGPLAHHVLGKRFWDTWALNRDELISSLQSIYKIQEQA